MDEIDIAARGRALAEARKSGRVIAPLDPPSPAAAEAVQRAASEAMGEARAGWKIGATSPEAQSLIGCEGPFLGPLFAPRIARSGAEWKLPEGFIGLECEIAARMGSDVAEPADADAIARAVASLHPAIELIGRREIREGLEGVEAAIADFGLNVGFVHGPAIPEWTRDSLADATVRGLVDGRETNRGTTAAVLGHPLDALAWAAQALIAMGRPLRAGDWVTTGTCLGVVKAGPGDRVEADFGPLGRVAVRLI